MRILFSFCFFLTLSVHAKDYSHLAMRCSFVLKGFTHLKVDDEHTVLEHYEDSARQRDLKIKWFASPGKGKKRTLKRKASYEVNIPEELSPGDTLKFPDSEEFKLLGYYGSGGNVDVFRVEEGGHSLALRSPNYRMEGDDIFHLKDNKEFLGGVKTYKNLGVKTVDVVRHARDSSWALVKPVDKKFELTEFLLPHRKKILEIMYGSAEMTQATKAYTEFLRSIRKFALAEDFGAFQVVWDGKDWVYLDPSDPVVVLTDDMLVKHPAMILKSPITPEMDAASYNQIIKLRLKSLKEDFPKAYPVVKKFLRENKSIASEERLKVEVDLSEFESEIRSL